MQRKTIGLMASALIIVVLLIVMLKNNWGQEQVSSSMVELADGTAQLDFTTVLTPLNQPATTFETYKGKVLVVNFWASWCGPCQQEAPALNDFYQQKPQQVELLAINATKYDSYEQAVTFQENHQLAFPIFLDKEGTLQQAFQVLGYPTTFIFDMEGILQYTIKGEINQQELNKLVATINS
ncbi:TlpA disulfide reductase family protein [Lysinibacillus sp. FSL K6-0232]|uniref:TlpA family protein disulfide reductase n=1 Tax=unclassified Lysinibacillus TaxID=2636778 RepID=UPI0030FA07FA